MTPETSATIAWIISAVAVLIAAGSLCVSISGNRRAGKANTIAGESRDAAQRSADAAQRSADEAAESNRLAERASDPTDYEWAFDVNEDGLPIALKNNTAHAAVDVRAVIDSDGEKQADIRVPSLAAFDELPLDLSGLYDEHVKSVQASPVRPRGRVGDTLTNYRSETVTTPIRATIDHSTDRGGTRHYTIRTTLNHRIEGGGLRKMRTKPDR